MKQNEMSYDARQGATSGTHTCCLIQGLLKGLSLVVPQPSERAADQAQRFTLNVKKALARVKGNNDDLTQGGI
jgi:hypothetical protein